MKRGAAQRHHYMLFLFLSIIVSILAISVYMMWFREKQQLSPELDPYESEYPPDWVDVQGDVRQINVSEATQRRGDLVPGHQRYYEMNGQLTVLFFSGAYNGNVFSTQYKEGDRTLFMIRPGMNISDGIPEFFAVYRRQEERPQMVLFVDEDWKQLSGGRLNIVWSDDFGDNSSLQGRPYDFSQEKDGVYIDTIDENLDWVANQNPIVGGIFVSSFDVEGIRAESFLAGTYVFLR
ncbi:MAG: hypothetical protein V1735_03665 [Nanoarchaeota archaeon]